MSLSELFTCMIKNLFVKILTFSEIGVPWVWKQKRCHITVERERG